MRIRWCKTHRREANVLDGIGNDFCEGGFHAPCDVTTLVDLEDIDYEAIAKYLNAVSQIQRISGAHVKGISGAHVKGALGVSGEHE